MLDRHQEIWFASDIKKEVKKYEINFERELWRTTLFCKGCFHAHSTLSIRKGRSEIRLQLSESKMGLSALLLAPCFSPASQNTFQPTHKRSSTRDSSMHKELSDHLLARKTLNNLLQKAAGKEAKSLFPCHNLINTVHLSFGKPAVMWEGTFLSPGNYCLFGGLKWHGREKGNFKNSYNFIVHKTLSAHAMTV